MNINRAHKENILKTMTQALENKNPEPKEQAKDPEIQNPEPVPIDDTVEISKEAKDKSVDFNKMLEKMREEMRALREGLKQAMEAGEGAAAGWKDKIKCLQIAMRIMSGDKVPIEDHRFLRDRDIELYSKAIKMRIVKEDPKEYDRLSEDEEDSEINTNVEKAPDSAPPTPDAQPVEAAE